ncbi:MAG: hypothetical protein ACRDHD_11435 [Candidatus Limnocylindria bacterium]
MTYVTRLTARQAARDLAQLDTAQAAAGLRPRWTPDSMATIGGRPVGCWHCGLTPGAHPEPARLCPEWALRAAWGDR